MPKRSSPPYPTRCNGHHRAGLVEPLPARLVRLRIARGYSVYELATAASGLAPNVHRCIRLGRFGRGYFDFPEANVARLSHGAAS